MGGAAVRTGLLLLHGEVATEPSPEGVGQRFRPGRSNTRGTVQDKSWAVPVARVLLLTQRHRRTKRATASSKGTSTAPTQSPPGVGNLPDAPEPPVCALASTAVGAQAAVSKELEIDLFDGQAYISTEGQT